MTQFINQRTLTDLKTMSPEAIAEAVAAGELASLMGAAVPVDLAATARESEPSGPRPPSPNPGQAGAAPHGALPTAQLERADLETMDPVAIIEARVAGRLDNVLGMAPRPSIDPRHP